MKEGREGSWILGKESLSWGGWYDKGAGNVSCLRIKGSEESCSRGSGLIGTAERWTMD